MVIAILIIAPSTLQLQESTPTGTGAVTGIVVEDQNTSMPIDDVLVQISSNGGETRTDSSGYWYLGDIPAGTYQITYSKNRYNTLVQEVTITDSTTKSMNAQLQIWDPDNDGIPGAIPRFEWNTAAIISAIVTLIFAGMVIGIVPAPFKIKGFIAAIIAIVGAFVTYSFGMGWL